MGIYEEAIVIDGLNVSNWDSPAVFQSLHAGRVTAINATVVAWENFVETLAHLSKWPGRFDAYKDILIPVRDDGGHQASEGNRSCRHHPGISECFPHRE